MYQTPLPRQQILQILKLIQGLSFTKLKRQALNILSPKQWRQLANWLLLVGGMWVMLLWNWQLLLATVTGISLMLLVYLAQGWNWQVYLADFERFWQASNRKLVVAVVSGGMAAFSTYLAVAIWLDADNRWLATGAILQGLGTLVILLLLFCHLFNHQNQRHEAIFEQLIQDLSDNQPLKRLIAVRQLTRLGDRHRLSTSDRQQLQQYFRLLLVQESEIMIRDAVLEGLQHQQEWQSSQIPIHFKRSIEQRLTIKSKIK